MSFALSQYKPDAPPKAPPFLIEDAAGSPGPWMVGGLPHARLKGLIQQFHRVDER